MQQQELQYSEAVIRSRRRALQTTTAAPQGRTAEHSSTQGPVDEAAHHYLCVRVPKSRSSRSLPKALLHTVGIYVNVARNEKPKNSRQIQRVTPRRISHGANLKQLQNLRLVLLTAAVTASPVPSPTFLVFIQYSISPDSLPYVHHYNIFSYLNTHTVFTYRTITTIHLGITTNQKQMCSSPVHVQVPYSSGDTEHRPLHHLPQGPRGELHFFSVPDMFRQRPLPPLHSLFHWKTICHRPRY